MVKGKKKSNRMILTVAMTADPTTTLPIFFFFFDLALSFLATQTGRPIIIAGTAIPASSAIPTGAPISIPTCHKIFFFFDHGFFPQKVQPDGLKEK